MNRRGPLVAIGAVVVALVGLNVLAVLLDEAVGGHSPGGRDGSSYATRTGGLAAYADLLARFDHPVRRLRAPLADAELDPAGTLVVDGGGSIDPADVEAMRSFVERGGQLVLVQASPETIAAVGDVDVGFTGGASRYRAIHESLAPIRVVSGRGERSYAAVRSHGTVALVADGEAVLATRTPRGRGDLVLVADSFALSNAGLAQHDNAAFGIAIVGGDGRTVTFAESVFGYGSRTGLAAVPSRWKAALLVLAVAVIAYGWARARRLGPPDQPERELPPARSEYVQALARTLARTREPDAALDGLASWARGGVARRAQLPVDATDEHVRAAARRIGLPDEEIDALFRAPVTEGDVLLVGQAAARIHRTGSEV